MSVSDDDRREDRKRTLVTMYRVVRDLRAWQVRFDADDPDVPGVLRTTWRELLDDGLVDDKVSAIGRPRYRLTYRGWLRGLILSGDVDTPAVRERCARLARALKAVVKGRDTHHDVHVSVDSVAANANLPEGWVVNAISSRLLGAVFPNDKWDAEVDGGRMVSVSPTFGLNHLFE